jgi:tRNA nucleotidyltransferase (CCA-adding enzyme)
MDFPRFKELFHYNLLSERPSTQILEWQQEGLLGEYLSELDRCVEITQDPKFHKYTVFEHCLETCDHTPPVLTLRWAGLLHDTGKALTQGQHLLCRRQQVNKLPVQNCPWKNKPCYPACKHAIRRITFYKHELASLKVARQVLKRFDVTGLDYKLIMDLIAMHMYNFSSDWTDKATRRFIERSGITMADLNNPDEFPLFRLRIADRLGRGLIPVTQRQRDFETRLKDYFERYEKPNDDKL